MNIVAREGTLADKEIVFSFLKLNSDFEKSRAEEHLKQGTLVIAEEKGSLVGTLRWHIARQLDAGVAEIDGVNVIITHQKHGVGSLLLNKGIESIKAFYKKFDITARKVYVLVSSTNKAAQGFYNKFGFREIAQLNTLFLDSETTLFYCLDL